MANASKTDGRTFSVGPESSVSGAVAEALFEPTLPDLAAIFSRRRGMANASKTDGRTFAVGPGSSVSGAVADALFESTLDSVSSMGAKFNPEDGRLSTAAPRWFRRGSTLVAEASSRRLRT